MPLSEAKFKALRIGDELIAMWEAKLAGRSEDVIVRFGAVQALVRTLALKSILSAIRDERFPPGFPRLGRSETGGLLVRCQSTSGICISLRRNGGGVKGSLK